MVCGGYFSDVAGFDICIHIRDGIYRYVYMYYYCTEYIYLVRVRAYMAHQEKLYLRIRRVNKSAYIILPRKFLEDHNLQYGDIVNIDVQQDEVTRVINKQNAYLDIGRRNQRIGNEPTKKTGHDQNETSRKGHTQKNTAGGRTVLLFFIPSMTRPVTLPPSWSIRPQWPNGVRNHHEHTYNATPSQ